MVGRRKGNQVDGLGMAIRIHAFLLAAGNVIIQGDRQKMTEPVGSCIGFITKETRLMTRVHTSFGAWALFGCIAGIVCADEHADGPVLKDLIPIVEEEGEAAYIAAETIGHLGAGAAEARPALEKACSSTNPRLRVAAAVALLDIHAEKEGLPEIAIKTLFDLLASKQPEIRREAIRGLSHAKEINPKDLRSIALALADEDELVAVHAADTLVEMGEAAVSLLADAIANERTAMWGMVALGRLGPKGKGGQSAVIKRLTDKDPILRQEAALTLSQIGPDSSLAVEALLPLLDDPVRAVQLAAAFSVSSLKPEVNGRRVNWNNCFRPMINSVDWLVHAAWRPSAKFVRGWPRRLSRSSAVV